MRHGSTLPVLETTVASGWVDYNGHMNDAAYAIVFSRSVDALMDRVGLDAAARRRSGQSLFTLKMMLHYFKEAKEGDALAVSCQLLEHDDKRMRVWLDMTAPDGAVFAASEQLLISVAQSDGSARAVEWSFETRAALEALAKAQSGLPHPPAAGSGVALKRQVLPTWPRRILGPCSTVAMSLTRSAVPVFTVRPTVSSSSRTWSVASDAAMETAANQNEPVVKIDRAASASESRPRTAPRA